MRLAAGDWTLDLLPDLGGAIGALRRRGRDVLRPTPAGASDPLQTACFPLVPYANRIRDGRFAFAGSDHRLPRNRDDQAHPLHGVGWLVPWRVEAADGSGATLVHDHAGDAAWPWAYRAEQQIALEASGLTLTLSIVSRDARAMPLSLGLHPYFAAADVTGLSFPAEEMWLIDDAYLPTCLAFADALADWAVGEGVRRGTLIDNSYAGWNGRATIARTDGDLVLTGTGTSVLHLYMPPGADFFCAEPTTAIPDGFNRREPFVLAPGARHAIGMTLRSA